MLAILAEHFSRASISLVGLAAENLDISILSGNVVHENLQLKKTAFDALALPVVVKSGAVAWPRRCLCR